MKTMCPPGYHHNGFVATHALGHMMYGFVLNNVWIFIYLTMSGNNVFSWKIDKSRFWEYFFYFAIRYQLF